LRACELQHHDIRGTYWKRPISVTDFLTNFVVWSLQVRHHCCTMPDAGLHLDPVQFVSSTLNLV
jgi:hypothetical protein